MANLRTDFRDWIPGPNGMQYRLGTTAQDNTSITDVTEYAQEGDGWSGEILNETNAEVNALNARLETANAEIRALDAQINQVRDPTTGLLSPIQTVVNNLFGLHREDALYADEYDALGLTADEYDAKGLTAFEYDTRGRILLT